MTSLRWFTRKPVSSELNFERPELSPCCSEPEDLRQPALWQRETHDASFNESTNRQRSHCLTRAEVRRTAKVNRSGRSGKASSAARDEPIGGPRCVCGLERSLSAV